MPQRTTLTAAILCGATQLLVLAAPSCTNTNERWDGSGGGPAVDGGAAGANQPSPTTGGDDSVEERTGGVGAGWVGEPGTGAANTGGAGGLVGGTNAAGAGGAGGSVRTGGSAGVATGTAAAGAGAWAGDGGWGGGDSSDGKAGSAGLVPLVGGTAGSVGLGASAGGGVAGTGGGEGGVGGVAGAGGVAGYYDSVCGVEAGGWYPTPYRATLSGTGGTETESTEFLYQGPCKSSSRRCAHFDGVGLSHFGATDMEMWVRLGPIQPPGVNCWYYAGNWFPLTDAGACEISEGADGQMWVYMHQPHPDGETWVGTHDHSQGQEPRPMLALGWASTDSGEKCYLWVYSAE